METQAPASHGFLGSLRELGRCVLGLAQERLELISLELQEEKFRLIQIFIWISAAVFAGVMAITFASITIVYLFWESARLAALTTLTALYTAALIVIIVLFRRFLARQPRPFSATLQELKEDRSCIPPEN